jgi:hypothetical protein
VAFRGNLFQRAQSERIFFDVRAALLISAKRKTFPAPEWRSGQKDLLREAAKDVGREFCAARATMQAGLNAFVKQRGERIRRENLGHAAESKVTGAQQPSRESSRKIHEVFHERVVPTAGDKVGHARTVGKEPSGMQRVPAPGQTQFALAADHVFNGIERERLAADFVIGRAVFQASTHDGEPDGAGRLEVQIKSPRFGNLGRKKIRLATLQRRGARYHLLKVNYIHALANYSHSNRITSKIFLRTLNLRKADNRQPHRYD